VLLRAETLGKHLFHVYGPDLVVHVHLGLRHWADLRGDGV